MEKFDFSAKPVTKTNTGIVTDIALRLLDAVDNGDVSEVLAVKGEYQPEDIIDAFNLLNDVQQEVLKQMGQVSIELSTIEG